MDPNKPPGIRISQIFLAKCLFEHVGNPTELSPTAPVGDLTTTVQVQAAVDPEDKTGAVSLVVATAPESTGLYRFHVEMVAIVERVGEPNMDLREYLTNAGPATLYPFIRETVATLTGKGRFGSVWVPPMNFAALAQQMRFVSDKKEEPASKKKPQRRET